MARKKYDYVIIGGGLTGLICTHALVNAGKKVALVEAQAHLGGISQVKRSPFGPMPILMNKITKTETCIEDVQRWASKVYPQENPISEYLMGTKTYDSGKFKDFVGFGKRAPEFVEIIQAYTNTYKIEFSEDLSTIVEKIESQLQSHDSCDLFLNSFCTNLKISEDSRIELAEINSSKLLEASEYIFSAPLSNLEDINPEVLSSKNKQALAKQDQWTSVFVEMLHQTEQAPTENDYILMAGTDKAVPCYGYFNEPTNFQGEQEDSYQVSQWISFVESNLTNDMEFTGNLVREIKKQVKRAHPEAYDSMCFERISLYPNSHGLASLKLEAFTQPNISNLRLVGKEVDSVNSPLGRIQTAVKLLDELDVPLAELSSSMLVENTVENEVQQDNLLNQEA